MYKSFLKARRPQSTKKPLGMHVALFMQNIVQIRAQNMCFVTKILSSKIKNLQQMLNLQFVVRPSSSVQGDHRYGPRNQQWYPSAMIVSDTTPSRIASSTVVAHGGRHAIIGADLICVPQWNRCGFAIVWCNNSAISAWARVYATFARRIHELFYIPSWPA